jgi:hypothetical protein
MKEIHYCLLGWYGEQDMSLSEFKKVVDKFNRELKNKMEELEDKEVTVSVDSTDGVQIYLHYNEFEESEKEEYQVYLKLKKKFEGEEE